MKKLYSLLLFMVITLTYAYSQNFEGRIVLDGSGFIAVQFRNTTGINLPNTSTLITDFEFDIRWLKAQENGKSADVKMMCHDGGYPFVFIEGPIWPQLSNLHQFRRAYITNSFYPPENWIVNEWVTVFKIALILEDNNNWHSLYGSLEIGEYGWGVSDKCTDPIVNQDGSSEDAIDVLGNGLSGITLPTPVELRWVGGAISNEYDEYCWNFGDNWEIICPGDDASNNMWTAPRFVDYCIIPPERTYYPRYPASNNEVNSACYDLLIEAGGEVNWDSPYNNKDINLEINGDLDVQMENGIPALITIGNDAIIEVGKVIFETGDLNNNGFISLTNVEATLTVQKDLYISNSNGLTTLGEVTIIGDTDVDKEIGLVIKADETGVGSFINNGDINFNSYSGAKVETYISGTVGDYYMHFAGPTVRDSTDFYRDGSTTGVRLEQFNMTSLDTYTYEWNPLADTTDHDIYPWINVYPFWHNVPVANGLAISNWEVGTGTMEMVGTLVTEEVSYNVQSFPNNNLELISNPFSSAIDFADLYYFGNNADVIKGHYWIYDASTGNYYGGALGSDSSMIQVGQGFFVEVNGNGGELIFNPSIRNHNKVVFREMNLNILKLSVSGGDAGYKDELTISFNDNATEGYDENLEAKKWNSFGSDATMVRSIADDGSELSVNAMPYESLNNAMTSIPVHFECGYETQYTFNFSGIETFEYDISIWMEDLFTGDWMSISETNPMFSFDGSPNDNKERFVLHFMGPTSIEEMDVLKNNKPVHIYASGNNVYIRNKSNQMIKEVTVYNILGQELYRDLVSVQDMHQIPILGNTGYYIVHVRTDQSFTTEKVFIKK